MGDLKNPKLIYLKGFLFLVAGVVSAALILMENLTVRRAVLLGVAVWSSKWSAVTSSLAFTLSCFTSSKGEKDECPHYFYLLTPSSGNVKLIPMQTRRARKILLGGWLLYLCTWHICISPEGSTRAQQILTGTSHNCSLPLNVPVSGDKECLGCCECCGLAIVKPNASDVAGRIHFIASLPVEVVLPAPAPVTVLRGQQQSLSPVFILNPFLSSGVIPTFAKRPPPIV